MLLRTLMRKIASARAQRKLEAQHREYEAQRKVADQMVADLDAIVENMKRARERERRETRPSVMDGSYIHPTKWRDAG
jgi:hypothetical protein